MARVWLELHDADGTLIHAGNDDRQARVRGAGTLAGIGNGDPVGVSSFRSGERKPYTDGRSPWSAPASRQALSWPTSKPKACLPVRCD